MIELSAVLHGLTAALLHSTWQVAICAGLFALLRARNPAAAAQRYGLGCFLLAVAAVAFVVTWCGAVWPAGEQAGSVLVVPAVGSAPAGVPVELWVALAWLVGMVSTNIWTVASYVYLRTRLASVARPPAEALATRFREIAAALGMTRNVVLRICDRIDVPATVGWIRPVVYLPASIIAGMSPNLIDAILTHELFHVRRYDFLANLMQTVVESMFFYHPALWWLSRQVRRDRELCCDVSSARAVGDRLTYARALVECEACRVSGPPALALSATGGDLMHRVRVVMEAKPVRLREQLRSLPGKVALLTVALVAAGFLVDACGEPPGAPRVDASGNLVSRIAWLPPSVERHWRLFEKIGLQEGVDPNLLALVALVESGGEPNAVSSRGARGVMQVMPETAAQIAADSPDLDHHAEQLATLEYNITLGARYLRWQIDTFAQEDESITIANALAAYNAGPRRARQHVRRQRQLPTETQRYVELLSALWRDRDAATSETYRNWRRLAHESFFLDKVTPLSGAAVTSEYGPRRGPFSGEAENHAGVDLAAASGTPVVAPQAARVVEVGEDDQRGRYVVLQHGGGIQTRYHHLGDVLVDEGSQVERGNSIGTVGSSGQSTGPHLHVELVDHGTPIDPTFLVNDGC